MRSIGVLIVRLVVGGLLAGHGAQKLFGAFGGEGLDRTAGWLETLRLRPGDAWARVAGGSELGGGVLTMLGFLNPMGPIAGIGAMSMAWAKVHLGKPVWSTKGGAELPLTNIAVLSAITIAGPGRLSVDGLLGIRVPRWLGATALAAMFGTLWVGAHAELQRAIEAATRDADMTAATDDIKASDRAATSGDERKARRRGVRVQDIEPMDLPGTMAGGRAGSAEVG